MQTHGPLVVAQWSERGQVFLPLSILLYYIKPGQSRLEADRPLPLADG